MPRGAAAPGPPLREIPEAAPPLLRGPPRRRVVTAAQKPFPGALGVGGRVGSLEVSAFSEAVPVFLLVIVTFMNIYQEKVT